LKLSEWAEFLRLEQEREREEEMAATAKARLESKPLRRGR
jgi:hypothetical protein